MKHLDHLRFYILCLFILAMAALSASCAKEPSEPSTPDNPIQNYAVKLNCFSTSPYVVRYQDSSGEGRVDSILIGPSYSRTIQMTTAQMGTLCEMQNLVADSLPDSLYISASYDGKKIEASIMVPAGCYSNYFGVHPDKAK